MRRVAEGVEEADRQALDRLARERRDDLAQCRLVEGLQHVALVVEPFRHRQAPAARHQRLGQRDVQVVLVVAALVAEGEHVAETLGRDQRRAGALALDQRIGGEGRAMDEEVDVAGFQSGAIEQQDEPVEHAALGRFRRRQDLGGDAGAVDRLDRQVGEGPADIDREPRPSCHP